jgi:hypothetical protein
MIRSRHAIRKNPLTAVKIAVEKTYMRLRTLNNKSGKRKKW